MTRLTSLNMPLNWLLTNRAALCQVALGQPKIQIRIFVMDWLQRSQQRSVIVATNGNVKETCPSNYLQTMKKATKFGTIR